MMHPLTCAGLSFVATASLLIWDVFDQPACPAGTACAGGMAGDAQAQALPNMPAPPHAAQDDLLCTDPRIVPRWMLPQVRVWSPDPGATCP